MPRWMIYVYKAHFYRYTWSTVGVPENMVLASALQNMMITEQDARSVQLAPYLGYDTQELTEAYDFVRKYSACEL